MKSHPSTCADSGRTSVLFLLGVLLSISLSPYPPVTCFSLSLSFSMYLPTYLPIISLPTSHLSIYLPTCHLFICLPTHPSLITYVYLSAYLSSTCPTSVYHLPIDLLKCKVPFESRQPSFIRFMYPIHIRLEMPRKCHVF